MTDRPILFSAEMVRAILDGRKTQTRRAIKPVPTFNGGGAIFDGGDGQEDFVEPYWVFPKTCKYGQPGDFLWVRETWTQYPIELNPEPCDAWYKATSNGPPPPFKWRPSIHMPRWASRITLEVKGVRVERLQDISEDDAKAEGCEARPFPGPWWQGYRDLGDGELIHQQAVGDTAPDWMIEPKKMPPTPWLDRSARDGFRSIWMGLYGPDAWDENPWVWVVAFERVKP
jgi:hypothetical protein